jgi:hypothetical protein
MYVRGHVGRAQMGQYIAQYMGLYGYSSLICVIQFVNINLN